jgi:hypothetical protein
LKVTLNCTIIADECLGRREAGFIDAFKLSKNTSIKLVGKLCF